MNPEHDLIAVPQELHQHERLLQLHALLRQPREQQLPQAVQLGQPPPYGLGGEVPSRDHLRARVVQNDDGIRVGGYFGLESLVLLDLGLGKCNN